MINDTRLFVRLERGYKTKYSYDMSLKRNDIDQKCFPQMDPFSNQNAKPDESSDVTVNFIQTQIRSGELNRWHPDHRSFSWYHRLASDCDN